MSDDALTTISGLSDISCSAAEFDSSTHSNGRGFPSTLVAPPSTLTPRRDSWFQKAKSFTSGASGHSRSHSDDVTVVPHSHQLPQHHLGKVSPVAPSVARLFHTTSPDDDVSECEHEGEDYKKGKGKYRSKLDQEVRIFYMVNLIEHVSLWTWVM